MKPLSPCAPCVFKRPTSPKVGFTESKSPDAAQIPSQRRDYKQAACSRWLHQGGGETN